MTTSEEFDRNYVSKEIEVLRGKISEYVAIISNTERLCVGASGIIAAFLMSNMADAAHSAKIVVATMPFFIIVLGWLRCFSLGYIVLDILNYIESAEKIILSHEQLGFQRCYEAKKQSRAGSVSTASLLFWLIGVFSALAFFILVATQIV